MSTLGTSAPKTVRGVPVREFTSAHCQGTVMQTWHTVTVAANHEELLIRVRAWRERGSTPKQIAKALGLRPAQATALVRQVAEAVGLLTIAGGKRREITGGRP
jgi:hypothetical protein